ncbi:selenide, water dikinase SelD [Actibacterium sp. 188UL27-1]|uniref:selenide, water dikinase SelD n=1 Tax=Actibacterium sp. 188UL27-1 TaxID=2786961 RepID=UPI001957F546|nr:selenide, water dikinase SelD [Actibacterium sp. 188UL27-1]MBM7069457.1 selenide, water dikinase SelD [Actibacterium sp. 188UL27-1]
MDTPLPLTRDLVFMGGGHAHALVLRQWGMRPLPGVRVTLINPDPAAPYTGMLPGHVAGHYAKDELIIDLVRLARFAGARLVLGRAMGMDREAKLIHVPGRPPIRYDVASINVGITADMPDLPGFRDHGIGAKPLDRFAARWDQFVADVTHGRKQGRIAVIGGGVAGCELGLAMAHRLEALEATPHISIVERGRVLDGISGTARALLFERMRVAGIRLFENIVIREVQADRVLSIAGQLIPADLTIGAAGARPHDWVAELGLANQNGFLTVDKYLRSITDPSIYAAGDCATMLDAPRPKAGVFAVRQAPILYRNLRADLSRAQRTAYRPQKRFLKLISLGAKDAVAEGYALAPSGPWLWRLKDKIDRDFMEKFTNLPVMPKPAPPREAAVGVSAALDAQPLCGGCGSKVASATLTAALDRLPAVQRADVTIGPGDDAAILTLGDKRQVLTTDHLRAFSDDPVLMTRVAATHALGDVWAMGAAPQAATANIILPPLSGPMQAATLNEIMETATHVFRAAGADLAGGHTTVGAELTVGFTITGLCDQPPVGQDGARAGDALVLTRPIGAGTVLAAEMQGRAKGDWVANVWRHMTQPQGAAARILGHAHAMTDVTGFGLAGHLLRMCQASGIGAQIHLADIPIYRGATDLASRGIRSTLYAANRQDSEAYLNDLQETPASWLLFDPQTAGGLLAAVPADDAQHLIKQLRGAGMQASQIGQMVDGPPAITLR